MASSSASVRPGDLLAGKYRVEKVLGTGAMGVVVSAMHVDLHERRAIKFMLPSMLEDKEGVERFLREARSAVRLKSQHVAKIHDIGRLENGAPYMVMELLQGSDLKEVLENRGPLPITEAVGYMMQVCEAIAEAHDLGIVHRDLKPANLFVTRGANGLACVKVLDFGIAKLIGNPDGVHMTQTSNLMGTPLYMSPEQMRGAHTVDARSDVWALGAILYRFFTNRTPFEGDSVTQICASVIADEPEPVAKLRPEVPPVLDAAVMRCLEKEASQRFQTVRDFAAAIAPFAQSHGHRIPSAVDSSPHLPMVAVAHTAVPAMSPDGSSAPRAKADKEGSLAGSSHGLRAKKASRTSVGMIVGAVALIGVGAGVAAFVATREPASSKQASATAEPRSASEARREPGIEAGAPAATTAHPQVPSSAAAAATSAVASVITAPAAASASSSASSTKGSAAPPIVGAPPQAFTAPRQPVTPPNTNDDPPVSYDDRR